MAYTSLYRRYRPETFRDVIGQDHIVRTLVNQIRSGNVGHAYLFTGTRGTGKTSVAKIFARAVNCEHPEDGSPCGKCGACLELALSGNFDVLEIDAASNNSVDQIRELTDKINFPPTIGKFKVYIIDEVHMLSKSAHNALLKTLEEPPSHAIFVLATTEAHAIPATILSRCLRFDFRLVADADIAARVRFIFDDNKIACEPEALRLIASSGTGSVRDALSIADMCLSYCSGNITYKGVLEVLGASDPGKLAELAGEIAAGNVGEALSRVADMCALGKSVPILAADLAKVFRNALYIKSCPTAKEILQLPEDQFQMLRSLAEAYPAERCLQIMRAMTELEGEFRYSTQHRILFEAAVVLAATGATPSGADGSGIRELEARLAALERRIASAPKTAVPQRPANPREIWKRVAAELERRGFRILSLAVTDAEVESDGKEFVAKVSSRSTLDMLTEKESRDVINSVFSSLCDQRLRFEEIKRIDEDSALPYIKSMFGSSVEIK